jgi:hypothetical protein
MRRRSALTTTKLNRALRTWRQDGRLDEGAEVLAASAVTLADLVDRAHAPDSDVSAYARADVSAEFRTMVELLARVGPGRGEEDPFERIARELAAIDTPGAEAD